MSSEAQRCVVELVKALEQCNEICTHAIQHYQGPVALKIKREIHAHVSRSLAALSIHPIQPKGAGMSDMIERVGRAIADQIGDGFDNAFAHKGEWRDARGNKGGRFRDVNEPFQSDFLDAAIAAVKAMREPDDAMVDKMSDFPIDGPGYGRFWPSLHDCGELWKCGIDSILSTQPQEQER